MRRLPKPEHLYVRTADIVNSGLWKLFPAINVDVSRDIPNDYPGLMGVPISFMDHFSERQFELIGYTDKGVVAGKHKYKRLLIRHLHPNLPEYIDLVKWFELMDVPLEIVEISVGN